MVVERGRQVVFLPSADDETLFGEATRFAALWRAWERIRANNGGAGGDGMTVSRFAQGAENRVSALSHRLRNGSYRPGPARRVLVPKNAGGFRALDIPPVIDRIAQGAVAGVLARVLDPEMEDASFAYRPGRSVLQAVTRVASHRRDGYRFVVDGDIVRYFENVPHERLIARLERSVDDLRLIDLVALWLEHHSHDERGLPQGSPLSPVLANLFLDDVDEAIEGRGVRLVRFADDFVLLCKSEEGARAALSRMLDLLASQGLELHPENTKIVPFDRGFRFLGHVFVRSMVWKEVLREEVPPDDAISAAEQAIARLAPGGENEAPARPEQPVPRGRWAPHQRLLYVIEPGRTLAAANDAFTVTEDGVTLVTVPQRRVDRIEVGPGASVDHSALVLAAASETDIVLVNGHGGEIGRFRGDDRERSRRHLAQAATTLDMVRRGALARAFVRGRIAGQRAYIRRLDRTRRDPELDVAAVRLGRILRKLDAAAEVEAGTMMGFEGEAAAIYWPAIGRGVPEAWAFSGRRIRRSRADPFNIVLDVLASMLVRDIRVAVERAGLHPGFSVLHAVEDGREGLAFDLAEEFRAPVAEACALALIARRSLSLDMFSRDEEGWRMTRDGWGPLIRGYEAWLARPIRDPASGRSLLWRGLFDLQAQRFAVACESAADYRPYAMDY